MKSIDEKKAVREIVRLLGRQFGGPGDDAARDRVVAGFEKWLGKQREVPEFVGSSAAAKILGIPTPHVSRLRDQGRMPDPIPVEGSVDIYVKGEVETLAKELKRERADRAERRAAREAARA